MVEPADVFGVLSLTVTNLNGLLGIVLLALVLAMKLLPTERLSVCRRWLIGLVIVALVAIPYFDFSAAVYIRGVVGDLSLTTVLLLISTIARYLTGKVLCSERQVNALFTVVVPVGLIFYPMALGLGPFAPYSLGFGSIGFLLCLLVLCCIAWIFDYLLISICLAAAVGAYSMQWYDSNNLWDYLMDPLLVIYGFLLLVKRLCRFEIYPLFNGFGRDQVH